jgi:L-iditol 2-dehydrogenase
VCNMDLPLSAFKIQRIRMRDCFVAYIIALTIVTAAVLPHSGVLVKAIVISGPGKAKLDEVTLLPLAEDEVRVRVLATGCCGTDVELLDGTMPYFTSGMGQYPLIPGHEWTGEVNEIGSEVRGFTIGDRVVGECSCGCMRCERCRAGNYHRCAYRTETGVLNRSGGFAEYMNFPATFLHRISEDVPIESACLVEPAAVAFNGVRKAQVTPSDDVAIFGDGPIGLLLVMMAKACSARTVTLVGATADRLAIGATLGATATINANEQRASAFLGDGKEIAPSVIVEATGNPASVLEAVSCAAPGARLVLQGIFAGRRLNDLNIDQVVINEISIQGALGSPGLWPDVIRLIEGGGVNPALLVTEMLPLDEYHRAMEMVRKRRGMKTVVLAKR